MKQSTKQLIGALLFVIGILGVLYIGIYLGIISPILTVAAAYDAGTLTGTIVATQLIWFFAKEVLAWIWAMLVCGTGMYLIKDI